MSKKEQDTSSLSILLPTARVEVFAHAKATVDLFEKLKDDWRFARVTFHIERSDIDSAISRYSEYESPDLVVIGTNDISDAFTEQLGDLSKQCREGTEAVIVGPKNDVQLYRSLVGMGVRDYLVRPLKAGDMIDVIAATLFDKIGVSDSRLIAVIGAKGGLGTTALAQNVAQIAAADLGAKTMLMDAAGGRSTLGLAFGVEPSNTLMDGLKNGVDGTREDLERMYAKTDVDELEIFACGGDPLLGYAPDADVFEQMVDRIMKTHPVVVVDLSAASAEVRQRVVSRAHETFVVSSPRLTSLRVARTLIREIDDLHGEDGPSAKLILNMRGVSGVKEITDADIETALEHKPDASITYASELFTMSETSGKPVVALKGGEGAKAALLPLVAKAIEYKGDLDVSEKSSGSLVDKIMTKIKKADKDA